MTLSAYLQQAADIMRFFEFFISFFFKHKISVFCIDIFLNMLRFIAFAILYVPVMQINMCLVYICVATIAICLAIIW